MLTPCFWVGELDGAIGYALPGNRKSDMQDGGCQSGSTFISASVEDRKEIPSVIYMVLGVEKLNSAIKKIDVETGSEKFKMADAKTGYTCNSTSMLGSKEIPTVICRFSGSDNLEALFVMHYLETGSENFKMAAAKPEVHVSELRYKIAKKVHRVFRVKKLNDAIKRLDVEVKVTHMTIKCCNPLSELHAW
jgi:hypothetical protein